MTTNRPLNPFEPSGERREFAQLAGRIQTLMIELQRARQREMDGPAVHANERRPDQLRWQLASRFPTKARPYNALGRSACTTRLFAVERQGMRQWFLQSLLVVISSLARARVREDDEQVPDALRQRFGYEHLILRGGGSGLRESSSSNGAARPCPSPVALLATIRFVATLGARPAFAVTQACDLGTAS